MEDLVLNLIQDLLLGTGHLRLRLVRGLLTGNSF